jgi:hypothetical protein
LAREILTIMMMMTTILPLITFTMNLLMSHLTLVKTYPPLKKTRELL